METAGRQITSRLEAVLEVEMLQRSVTRLEQAERLQRALYAIADQANSDRDMPDVLRAMHEIVGSLMYAENFYIVLYDRCATAALRVFRRRRRHRRAVRRLDADGARCAAA